ncbi:MAG TPA: protein-L-isoaspartate(D-aspartate) O-methyltransferase [Candidatus Dormibacteraeota bacterium]|jgi:protein-L-isoaspartate(D-aspartate) O-methyltransferase|nr:protein-L-isoaspartate(D-aspartate) O-methyltransferase [Candidatus Dormibacteraeota bacterium]
MGRGADFLGRLWGGGAGDPDSRRAEMLDRLRRGGVHDDRVLAAMADVPREAFVIEGDELEAYADRALPIGHGQTISQPLMVGVIVQALQLRPGERVLDVGTGSGYQAAVIAACGGSVVSVERIEELAWSARARLERMGIDIEVVAADGSAGLDGRGPFDAIAVGAAAPRPPLSLIRALADGGRLVVPVTVGDEGERLLRVRRQGRRCDMEDLGPCRFVRLVGREGY